MTEEQLLAINKKYGNILVSASAGSGKTTVLIERIISKCINEKIDIDRLLVVTFTNAAAAELKERLLLAIYKELDKDPSNKFLKRQLINLNRASITTIHSFCLDVITSNFYLLDLDPNVSICDESLSNILKNKAIENILDKEYEKNNSDVKQKTDELYKVMKMFSGNDDKFIDTILNIYSYINSFAYPFLWLKEQIEKYNIKDIDVDLCEYDFGKQIYDDCINNLMIIHVKLLEFHEKFLKIDNSSKFLDVINQDMEMIDRCIKCSYNSWDKLYSNLNDISFLSMPRTKIEAEDLKLELQNFRNTYMKNSVKKLKESVYENSKNISTELLSCYNYLTFLYNFLFDFNNEYSNLKKLANVIDFNDIEHMALSVLTKRIDKEDGTYEYVPSDIAKKIQEKFVQVYIDEYQDTSFVQEAILSAVSGMKNRFMVGDIKQSIYKFRQAMPQIFNEKYEKYSLLKNINESEMLSEEQDKCYKILLSKNFRSRKSVIDSINYIFEKIMSKRLGECDYSNLEKLQFGASYYTENDSTDYITEINIVDKKEEDNSTYDNEEESQEYANYIKDLKRFEIEAEYIAKRIYEYINKEKNKVTNKDGSLRNVTYKDIVLLLRSIKNKGQILEAALKKYNIPAFADTNTNLFDSDEILLVMSMLSVIDNPYQDIPLVSVMYSIIGNFTLDDLCDISKYKEDYLYNVLINVKNGVYDKDKEEYYLKEKVNKFLNILEYFRKYKEVYSISELLIHLYKKTNIYYQFYAKKIWMK